MTDALSPHERGVVLRVRAVPGASSARVVGIVGDEVRVRVCSPPVDGRANDEVTAVVAAALGLKRRQVELLAGHTARSKRLLVQADEADVRAWLGTLPADGAADGANGASGR